MHAVSIDDAWGDSTSLAPTAPPPPPVASVCSTPMSGGSAEGRSARRSGRSGRRTTQRGEEGEEGEISVLASSIASLNSELLQLRDQMERQGHVQRTVMYVCAVVAIVLLCVVVHAQSKLTHVGECLLWWGRRSDQ